MKNIVFRLAPLGIFLGGVFLFSPTVLVGAEAQKGMGRVDHGIERIGPTVYSRKEEQIPYEKPCQDLAHELEGWDFFGSPYTAAGLEEAWKPWSSSDLKAIESCDSFPCAVKLDGKEVGVLENVEKDKRKNIFFDLVGKRVSAYETSDVRSEYEFPGTPIDPWKKIIEIESKQKNEIKPSAVKKKKLTTRFHRFTDQSYRPLRQVFDVRMDAKSETDRVRLSWLVRDAYTAHYFDGWGEWIELSCVASKKLLILKQGLFLEFDLFKKTDFFSRLSQGTMVNRLRELSDVYQRLERDSLFKKIGLASLPTPRPNY